METLIENASDLPDLFSDSQYRFEEADADYEHYMAMKRKEEPKMCAGNHIINYNQNIIECRCPLCGKNEVLLTDEDTIWNFVDYRKGKGLIQEIFSDKDASFREWLMTGYCESCQEMMFANPEEEFETV